MGAYLENTTNLLMDYNGWAGLHVHTRNFARVGGYYTVPTNYAGCIDTKPNNRWGLIIGRYFVSNRTTGNATQYIDATNGRKRSYS